MTDPIVAAVKAEAAAVEKSLVAKAKALLEAHPWYLSAVSAAAGAGHAHIWTAVKALIAHVVP